jgi:spermidine synthase
VSTAGSVVGALATGFLLVPRLPLDWICYLLALSLLLAAALFRLAAGAFRAAALVIALPIAGWLLSLAGLWPVAAEPLRGRTLFHGQSLYGELRVVEMDKARLLLLNNIVQSGIDGAGRSVFPYPVLMEQLVPPQTPMTPSPVLLIGLGGGVRARSLERGTPDRQPVAVDVVELDPLVAELARRYFGYAPRAGALVIEDGRRFLQTTDRRYAAILLDAYAAEALPAHLFSAEAFDLMRRRLTPDGRLLLNYRALAGNPDAGRAFQALGRTLRTVFPSVTVFDIDAEGPLHSQIFVATMAPAGRPRGPELITLPSGPFSGRPIAVTAIDVTPSEGLVLTDGYNPMEFLDAPAAEMTRLANRRYLAPHLIQ